MEENASLPVDVAIFFSVVFIKKKLPEKRVEKKKRSVSKLPFLIKFLLYFLNCK